MKKCRHEKRSRARGQNVEKTQPPQRISLSPFATNEVHVESPRIPRAQEV